jgi:hypothetical protein
LIFWPLLLVFVPLVSTLGSCILILLCCLSHQRSSERARSVKIIQVQGWAVIATVTQGYDLEPRRVHCLQCVPGAGIHGGCVGGESPGT